jgi:hypothetical protein
MSNPFTRCGFNLIEERFDGLIGFGFRSEKVDSDVVRVPVNYSEKVLVARFRGRGYGSAEVKMEIFESS